MANKQVQTQNIVENNDFIISIIISNSVLNLLKKVQRGHRAQIDHLNVNFVI
jgi:hypothetical protein